MNIVTIILLCLIPGLILYPMLLVWHGVVYKQETEKSWLELLKYLYRTLLFSVFWPLFGILYVINEMVERQSLTKKTYKELKGFIYREQKDKYMGDVRLRFSFMGGAGDLECKVCGYKQYIISFLHGFEKEPDYWHKSGYQCQQCGKIISIEKDHSRTKLPRCECGGKLSREEPLFCPKCNSFNLEYRMRIIT